MYLNILTWVVNLFRVVAYDNYDDFQHVSTSYFHKFSFHYFDDYLTTKPTFGQGIF
jgi:hypothetical protein